MKMVVNRCWHWVSSSPRLLDERPLPACSINDLTVWEKRKPASSSQLRDIQQTSSDNVPECFKVNEDFTMCCFARPATAPDDRSPGASAALRFPPPSHEAALLKASPALPEIR